ncbi:MAG: amino acid racemase [Trueperaceae bacterium]
MNEEMRASATKARPVIGVLGGMGPEATLDFYAKLIAATPASTDQDHLHVIIDADPSVPDRSAAIAGTGPSPGPQLAAMARRLEAAGADVLVMTCNSAHAFQDEVTAAVGIPFVSIVEESVALALAAAPGARRVGVLATTGTRDARLYADAFALHGVETLEPAGAGHDTLMRLIYRVKAGDKSDELKSAMRALADDLVSAGAQAVVAGCTEVPLVLEQHDVRVPFVSSTDALVAAAVAIGTGARSLR